MSAGPGVEAALSRARRFVEVEGDALARAHLHALLGSQPADAVVRALASRQAPDGSFPTLGKHDTGRPGPAGTLQVLTLFASLRCLRIPEVEEAVAYLASVQAADGSWAARAEDDERTRLVLTGLLAGHLAATDYVRPRVLDAAGGFLAAHWSPERVEHGDFGALAAFTCFFVNTPHDLADAALQWCGRGLERGFREKRIDALHAARLLCLCDVQALPGARLDGRELVPGLLAEQAGDGSWSFGPGLSVDWQVEATLDAVLALVRLAGASRTRSPR